MPFLYNIQQQFVAGSPEHPFFTHSMKFNCGSDITAALNGAMYLQTDTEIEAHRGPACSFHRHTALSVDNISPCEDLFWSQCCVNHPLVMLCRRSRFQCFNGATERFNSCRTLNTSGRREIRNCR